MKRRTGKREEIEAENVHGLEEAEELFRPLNLERFDERRHHLIGTV